jgi:hypothetical protein
MSITRYDMITNQILYGFGKRKDVPAEVFAAFQRRHSKLIEYLETHIPRHISVGVCGAIGKAILWHGQEKMAPFCDAISKGDFKGHDDPPHILYLWLMRRTKYQTKDVYKRTITVIRAFIEGKKIGRMKDGQVVMPSLPPAETDLFEWDDTYTLMIKKQRPDAKKAITKSVYDVMDKDDIVAEARDMLKILAIKSMVQEVP